MDTRSRRQVEFAKVFLKERRNGILYLCPRFGKCRVAIHILETVENPKVLIAYPDVKIKQSWEEEFVKMGYDNPNISFTTHRSLFKHDQEDYDLVIVDEIHLLSKAQISVLKTIRRRNLRILGLTGTLSSFTQKALKKALGLDVLATYSMEQAIEEKVVTDYQITVKLVALDKRVPVQFGKKIKSEKAHFDAYSYIINQIESSESGGDTKHLRLARMRIIQNSIAKLFTTKQLLNEFSQERILIFAGLTATADQMGCPVYHSKAGEKEIFEDFASGSGKHLAVVKIGNTGVTYKPLNKVIINYFDSNSENLAQKIFRCMAMEYDNPEKKADIWIISSDEEVELQWLRKSLEFFDESKVKYLR